MSERSRNKPVETDMYLAAVLSGTNTQTPCLDTDALAKEIRNHGIDGLAAAMPDLWPSKLSSDLRGQALALQFWEDQHKTLISEVLGALHDAGVPAMLIKGTACAYSVYQDPWTRTRGDSDVVIDPQHRAKAMTVLKDLGYARALAFSDEVAVNQVSFERVERGPGFSHVIDLHWQLSNSEVLAQLFSPADLLSRAVPLPRLCAQAQAPDPADALLITCWHRYVHRASPYTIGQDKLFSEDRLIWLMDIHLLAQSMQPEDWEAFQQRAEEVGLGAICASGLSAAQTLFDTRIPDDLWAGLRQTTGVSPAERYLLASQKGRWVQDFLAREGLSGKISYLRAHFFPPANYMRASFATHPSEPLAKLYLRRIWRGVAKRFRPASAE